MMRFFHRENPEERGGGSNQPLGSLETRVMQVLWHRGGESSVHDVCEVIDRPLAYTTVMTTLERLFKKGLLNRCKSGRAFLYSPAFSRDEWDRRRAGGLVAAFLEGPEPSRELLMSSLLDVIGENDPALLDELEKKIRARRKQLSERGRS
jgi:predicted transcriptional regulator